MNSSTVAPQLIHSCGVNLRSRECVCAWFYIARSPGAVAHRLHMRADLTRGADPLNQTETTTSGDTVERPCHTAPSGFLTLEELNQRHILAVLAAHRGNKSAAARALGISVRSVYRWLDRIGV